MATLTTRNGTEEHKVVSPKEWLAAREKLLVEEKKFTRLQDRLKAKRRALPWTRIDFNSDFHVSFTPEEVRTGKAFCNYTRTDIPREERPGFSTFYRDRNGAVYHTYSAYSRGIDPINTTDNLLDLTAKGRDENPA